MNFEFLAEADAATLQFEKAKRALETAKADLELARKTYDEVLARADEMGIAKAKLKKLTEERVQALLDSGLFEMRDLTFAGPKEPKVKKPRVKAAAPEDLTEGESIKDVDAEVVSEA